ncbi:MAG: flagellar basal body rod protein FlgC [Bacillota bacterium]
MSFFSSIDTSSSGLTAERLRMDLISDNIANAETTRTPSGGPYRRKIPIYRELEKNKFQKALADAKGKNSSDGVEIVGIEEDQSDFKRKYDPSHPDSNKDGYVLLPNVDTVTEMVNMVSASKAYEANVTALNSTKSMVMKALEIGR